MTEQTTITGPVGFIGLGNIGAPIATRLLDWSGGLVVFDVSPDACAELGERGAEVAPNAAEVACPADLVCVMVNTEAQVRDVLSGPDGIIAGAQRRGAGHDGADRPDLVVAVLSTISPQTAVELGTIAGDGGVSVLDVPVSGGAMGAISGTLALMVGGDVESFDRCREPFEMMGSLVHHFGPLGAGTRAKLVRNLITYASYVAVGEASRIAEAAGIDLMALGEVVRHSDSVTGGPGAIMVRDSAGPMAADDPMPRHIRTRGTARPQGSGPRVPTSGIRRCGFCNCCHGDAGPSRSTGSRGASGIGVAVNEQRNPLHTSSGLEGLSHAALAILAREYLLCGHLIDRAGMPYVIGAFDRSEMGAIAIDEWMGASPVYTRRMQKMLGFEGDDVPTIFKGMQFDIGAPHGFLDFRYVVHDPLHGGFELDHCGALMDVEPMGEEFVVTMCHDIEDPTFDATAMATNPRARMRPLHRPPREPSDRQPHCAWTVEIDQDADPLVEAEITAAVAASDVAATPLPLIPSGGGVDPGEAGLRSDYSGPLVDHIATEDFTSDALIAIIEELCLQQQLLAHAFMLAVQRRHGEEMALELGEHQFVGAAGIERAPSGRCTTNDGSRCGRSTGERRSGTGSSCPRPASDIPSPWIRVRRDRSIRRRGGSR